MEKLHNIKGVFLDLGGTLIFPPSGSWMFSELAYRYFPKEKLEEPRAAEARKAAHDALTADHLTLSIEKEYRQFYGYYEALAAALPELGLGEKELKIITEDKVYNKVENYGIFPDTLATLKALSGRYRLGIISDTWPSIVPVLEHMGILEYFDQATYSFELGVLKPDERMYQDALGKMGLPAGETLFVDDLYMNLQGARAQGINPVLIRAMPGIEAREDMHDIDRISGLLDILD